MIALLPYWLPDAATLRLLAPEFCLTTAIIALLVAPILLGRDTKVAGWIAALGAAAAALAAGYVYLNSPAGGSELFGIHSAEESVPGMLVADHFSLAFRLILMLFLLAIILMWAGFDAPRESHGTEFMVLLLSSAIGMGLMSLSVNLVMLVIAIELASMPSFALAGFDRFRKNASEAALKYVIFGAATSGFLIYGISVLYGLYGSLHLPTIVQRMAAAEISPHIAALLGVALMAMFAGIGFKISAVPFHFWCPDVFEGASLPVATWLSVASKAAGLALLLRLVAIFALPTQAAYAAAIPVTIAFGLGFFAVLTSTVANLAAFGQKNVRRLLAYSSIAHAGYMLALGALLIPGSAATGAWSALLQYLVVYAVMNLGAFLSLGLVAVQTEGREDMEAFTGLGWRQPAIAAALTICLVSLIGLPPMGGFIVKFWLIYALGEATRVAAPATSAMLWIVIIAIVLNTVISLFYYARIIRQMYLRGIGQAETTAITPQTFIGKAVVMACAVVLLLTGTLWVTPLKRGGDAVASITTVLPAPGAAENRAAITADPPAPRPAPHADVSGRP